MNYFISLNSTLLTKEETNLLKNKQIEGVVLYGKNILSFQTTQKLINSIKSIRNEIKIAIDEEGGIVSRISHFFPSYSQPYCSTLSLSQVRDYYKKRAKFLKDLGIDINFAPVVDIAFNENSFVYKRSFGPNPDKITELAKICIEEQKNVGIESCLKHFPGHGRSEKDSHQELPIVNISEPEWDNAEGNIFQDLIIFGVEYIMVGHLLFPKINSDIASISSFWVKEVLKGKLGFKGFAIADDICMKGLTNYIKPNNISIFNDVGLDSIIITEQNHSMVNDLLI